MKWRLFPAFALILILGAAALSKLERPGLAEESWTSIYYPQAALGSTDELSFTTQLTLYNPQPESVTAIPSFISASGDEQDWEPVTLGPNESILLTLESDGPLSVGQLQLSTSAPIGESLKYVIAQADGTTREEISVGSTEPATEFLLPVNNDGIHRSAVAVANPGSEMLSLALTLFDSDGFIVKEGELQVPARGQLARYIHELEGFAFVKPGFIGSLDIQASTAFTAMGLAENQNDNHLSSLRPFSPGVAEEATQLSEGTFVAHYPQSAYGFHVDSSLMVSTKLTVFSPHEEEVTVTALFFDHAGKLQQEIRSTVPPRGLRIIEPTAASLVVGQAQLIADRPVGQVLTYLFTNSQGRIVEEISVKETPPSKQYSIPVEISNSHNSSFAVANVADRPITIHAFLVSEEGEKGEETQFELGRGKQRARFFFEVFPGLQSFTGTAQFWSNEGDLVLMGLSTNRIDQHLSSLAGTPAVLDSSRVEVTLRAGDFNLKEISGKVTFLFGSYEVEATGHTTFWVPEGDYELNMISSSHWPEVLDIRRGFFGEYGPLRDTGADPDSPVIVTVGSNGIHQEFVGLLMDNLETNRIPGVPFDAYYTKENVLQFLAQEDGYKYEFVGKQAIEGVLENATGFDPALAFQRWRDVVSLQNSYGKGLQRVLIGEGIASEAISAASLAQGTLVLQVSDSAFSEVELQSDQSLINSAVASVPNSEATLWKTYAGQLLTASAGVRPIILTDSGQVSQAVSVEDILADGQDDLNLDHGLTPVAEKLTGLALHFRKGTFLGGQFVEEPEIRIEKSTNGEDADAPPGPSIQRGEPVTWTYEVLNTGNVLLSEVSILDDREGPVPCDQTTLGAGESMICASEGVAEVGQYENLGTVSARSVLGTEVSDDDPSHYIGVDSCYLLSLAHTGSGSDPAPSPEHSEGCPASRFRVGQTINLTASPDSGWAVEGWTNTNDDASTSNENQATMPDHNLEVSVNYVEAGAAITIEKLTNGQDADTLPGPSITVGAEVAWSYEVANTGNITLTNIIVTDDQLGSVCNQDELGPALTMTCVITATAELGQYENIGTAVGTPQGDLADVSDTDPSHYLGVTDEADLRVVKSTPGVEVFEGDILPYSIDVANLGPSVASSVVITDTLPAGTAFVSASDQCSYSGGEVICGLGELEAESGFQVVIEVEVVTTGHITNTVVVDADQLDPNPGNSVFEAVTLVAPRIDLAVSKTASTDAVMVGDLFSYTVDVVNDGASVATTVVITDTLPASVDFVSASPGCSHNAATVACNLGDLPAQGSDSVEIEVRVMAGGVLVNTVETASQETDLNPANNRFVHELTATSAEPAITIEKYTNGQDADTAPGPSITVGAEVAWSYEVANTGNITLTNIIVTDDQLGSVCNQDELGPALTMTCVITATAELGQYENIGTAVGTPQGDLADVSDTDPSHYLGVTDEADLRVVKSTPGVEVFEGDILPYSIDVANLGPSVASSVVITDTLPAGTAFVSASDQCSYSGGEVICGLGELEAESGFQVVIEVEVVTTGHITNTVVVDADQLDPNPGNSVFEAVTLVAPRIDLAVSKTASTDAVMVGDLFSYTVDVVNDGASVATTVVITDTLPVGVDFVSASPGCSHSNGTVVCSLDELGPHAGVSVDVEVEATAEGTLINSVEVAAQEPDVNPADNFSAHELTSEAAYPAISIEKYTNGQDADVAPGPPIITGQEVLWEFQVANTGNVTLTNVIVTDDQLGSICSQEELGPTVEMTCVVTATVELGQHENIGTAVGTPQGDLPDVSDTDPSHYLGVTDEADLRVIKSTPGVEVFEGDILPYSIDVTNLGPSVASSVVITDTLPAGTAFVSAPNQCGYGGGELVCGLGDLGADSGTQLTVEVEINTTGFITNTVQVAADQNDPNPANNFFEAVNAVNPQVDLSVSKAASTDTVMVGDRFVYTVDVVNEGPSVATTVAITDTLPADAVYVSASAGCSHSDGTVVCSLDDLAAQTGSSIEIEVEAIAEASLVNVVEVAAQEADVNPANNFSFHELTSEDPLPAISIEKHTNGQDADVAPGPTIITGQEVLWEFQVANTGNVTLTNVIVTDDQLGSIDCPKSQLGPDGSLLCSSTGTAVAGQHSNTATAVGTPPWGLPDVSDSDPSHYFGGIPGVAIEKRTNGQDADTAPGPYILAGDTVEWTYLVTNTGSVPLTDVQVTDDRLGQICTRNTVAIGESFSCTANGVAQIGQYLNFGLIQATQPLTTTDPSHYFGAVPTLTIEKYTNGQDADTAPGPTIPVGDDVSWTFEVANTGNITLTNIILIDDQIGEVPCPTTELGPDQFFVCSEVGIATAGQHSNTATAIGTPPGGLPDASASDPSHYFGGGP